MSAYEMMLSESQERMLAILKPGREADGERISSPSGAWTRATIGWTTDTGHLVLKHKGETVLRRAAGCRSSTTPHSTTAAPWVAPALQPRLTAAPTCPRPRTTPKRS